MVESCPSLEPKGRIRVGARAVGKTDVNYYKILLRSASIFGREPRDVRFLDFSVSRPPALS